MTDRHNVPTPSADGGPMPPERAILGSFAKTPRRRSHPPLALLAGLIAMALGLSALIVNAHEGPVDAPMVGGDTSTTRIQPIVAKDLFGAGPGAHRDSVDQP